MSYGTFVWFKYDALKPPFDLNLTATDVPATLRSITAWGLRISQNPHVLTPFIDNATEQS